MLLLVAVAVALGLSKFIANADCSSVLSFVWKTTKFRSVPVKPICRFDCSTMLVLLAAEPVPGLSIFTARAVCAAILVFACMTLLPFGAVLFDIGSPFYVCLWLRRLVTKLSFRYGKSSLLYAVSDENL